MFSFYSPSWHPRLPPQEYLYHLSEAVRQLAPESHDPHLHALEVGTVNAPQIFVKQLIIQTRCRDKDNKTTQRPVTHANGV